MTLLQKTMLKEILADPKSKNLKPSFQHQKQKIYYKYNSIVKYLI